LWATDLVPIQYRIFDSLYRHGKLLPSIKIMFVSCSGVEVERDTCHLLSKLAAYSQYRDAIADADAPTGLVGILERYEGYWGPLWPASDIVQAAATTLTQLAQNSMHAFEKVVKAASIRALADLLGGVGPSSNSLPVLPFLSDPTHKTSSPCHVHHSPSLPLTPLCMDTLPYPSRVGKAGS
jgi:hypothetical protein